MRKYFYFEFGCGALIWAELLLDIFDANLLNLSFKINKFRVVMITHRKTYFELNDLDNINNYNDEFKIWFGISFAQFLIEHKGEMNMEAILNSPKIKAKKLLVEAADNVIAEAKKVWHAAELSDKEFPARDFDFFRQKINDLYEQAIFSSVEAILSEYSRIENEANQKKSKNS